MYTRFTHRVGSKELVCFYDFNTNVYSFGDIKEFCDSSEDFDEGFVYKIKLLYGDYDFGDCCILGERCNICMSLLKDSIYIILQFSDYSDHFYNTNIHIDGCSKHVSDNDLYMASVVISSDIGKAFVFNHDFCFEYFRRLFDLAYSF